MTEIESTGTRERAGARILRVVAGGLVGLAVLLVVGVLASTLGFWRAPRGATQPKLSALLTRTIASEGVDAAIGRFRSLREQGSPGVYESEADTNALGYELLRAGEKEHAIRVFELNVETHPGSANVYDSLGEAHLAAGNLALAVESYRRAVAIQPDKKSAVSELARLTGAERASYRPMVLFHIGAGSLGLLSGAAAVSLRKGSRRHGLAGNLFFVSMLGLSASGAYMAFVDPDGQVVNVLMGVLTGYLVVTAWLTARRRNGETGLVDWGALAIALAVAAGLATYGLQAAGSPEGTKDGIPAGLYFSFAAVALLAGGMDLGMIARGGAFGARRIARHLWRMLCALFIGVTSLFLGQPQVFPRAVRDSGILSVPSLLVVILLIFWLIRVLFTKAYASAAAATALAAQADATPEARLSRRSA